MRTIRESRAYPGEVRGRDGGCVWQGNGAHLHLEGERGMLSQPQNRKMGEHEVDPIPWCTSYGLKFNQMLTAGSRGCTGLVEHSVQKL